METTEKDELTPRKPRSRGPAEARPEPDLPSPATAPEWSVPTGRASNKPQTYRIISVLSGVVVLLLIGALIFSFLKVADNDHATSLRNSALSTADVYGVYLSSYNYTDLTSPKASWSEVDSHSTAAFRTKFDATKSTLSSAVKDFHAVATGSVTAAGVQKVSNRQAVVLLFIDQTVTNSAEKPNKQTQPLRVQLFLARQGGKWLISDVEVPS